MKEIIVKNNETGLRVFINGVPNLKNIPKDEADLAITALELQISKYYDEIKKEQKAQGDCQKNK